MLHQVCDPGETTTSEQSNRPKDEPSGDEGSPVELTTFSSESLPSRPEMVLSGSDGVLDQLSEEQRTQCAQKVVQEGAEGSSGAVVAMAGAVVDALDAANLTHHAEDMRERAHKVCREYLHGVWRDISAEEMIIRKVSGGLSNLLYYCALPASRQPVHGEPVRVLLRLYGRTHGERALEGLITESVIFTLLSESQRGPRLFGIFPGGRLEEYIPARPLLTAELSQPRFSQHIAEKLAQIHLMDVPISKEPHWLWSTMGRWLDSIDQFMTQTHSDAQSTARAKQLLGYKLHAEVKWLRQFVQAVGSPVVFCHNDLQEGNILLRDTGPNSSDEDPQLVIIDFEYCSYNYRGFDFANHMCEWVYDYSNENEPYFWAKPDNYPSRQQQEYFVTSYLQVLHKGCPSTEPLVAEVQQLLKEVHVFCLASHLFWALWSVVNAAISTIPFDYWEYGVTRFEAYFQQKQKLLHEVENDSGFQKLGQGQTH